MLANYAITVACITTIALIWRALLLDHPAILATVERVPYAGGALRCGFCMALWLSLAGAAIYNPLAPALTALHWTLSLCVAWMAVGAGVLFLRNATAALMEGVGVLTHMHRSTHDER